ncbi:hypothetical protein RJ639_031455 [Escallonia herrerae]|uniref:SUEL-type lectin domain-containing protein n=1 Tax=Escallonia herrerae TaxID=1293975 RepID=A0AA88X476_9ASTE|nr:hypothetical protein RJ639_031455 [Escallonia herrerae]
MEIKLEQQNYGAFIEKDGAGFKGRIKVTGCKNGDIDLTESLWTYQVFQDEFGRIMLLIRTYFDAPGGTDPVVLNLGSMGKGQAWVNGHHIGRYHIPRSWLYTSSNLLVICEETGGNPFKISIKSLSTRAICAQVSETHYPPLPMWMHSDLINRRMVVNNMTPEMHLRCEDGHTISSIEFASYGTPQGSCQMFSRGNCHAPNSLSVVSQGIHGK